MKRVLVTGAAGYIGSILCPMLGYAGYKLCLVDNLFFGQKFRDVPQCNWWVIGDVSQQEVVQNLVRDFKPDVVIHLAAMVGMPICQKYPELAIMVNTEATRLFLEAIGPDVQFIAPNTNSQYGNVGTDILCTEETPTNPISLYSVTKCISEALILNRPNSVSLRLATVYGVSPTRMRDDLLVNNFVKKLVQDGSIDMFEPHYKRNFINIVDVSNAFIHAIKHNLEGVYNVGDDALNTTKGELAQNIANIVGGTVSFNSTGRDFDQRNYNCSSKKLYDTDYNIVTDFKEEVQKLGEYYRKQLDCQ
jgi:nucleoside-diphosphate-sugar epimerase